MIFQTCAAAMPHGSEMLPPSLVQDAKPVPEAG